MTDSTPRHIVATRVSDAERIHFLPRHFGKYMVIFEHQVYAELSHLSVDYRGGLWDFFDLTNGGCFIAPSRPQGYSILVEGIGFNGRLDAECAGIVATLFALGSLSMRHPTVDRFAARFHQLRGYACHHPDARLLLAAID